MSDDPLRNPRDPLHKSASLVGLDLFREMGRIASGKPADEVISAACNLLINALRQAHPDWMRAEKSFDEAFGRTKQLLKDHYDNNGRKKGIFPFDQVVSAPLHVDIEKFRH